MNILEQIAAKAEKGDTGMSLHYGFLYSCVVGFCLLYTSDAADE